MHYDDYIFAFMLMCRFKQSFNHFRLLVNHVSEFGLKTEDSAIYVVPVNASTIRA